MVELLASVAHWVPCTEAEGPGNRFALWFQGCPLRCPGCCNPEMLSFDGGQNIPISELARQIFAAQDEHAIEGITLLGGEPLAHADAAAALAKAARSRNLSVMVFTGYTLAEARAKRDPDVDQLLALTDILVDGRYDQDQPDTTRRWIGSTNQRIHFLTDRYHATDPCWSMKNTIEIRLTRTELAVNGFPTAAFRLLDPSPRGKVPLDGNKSLDR
jgi:anaerobic ribonucleoside-triphosphate reductase activating protein